MWLGANDNDHNGVYQWVNGHRCCQNFWIPGQPDNGGGNQRCLALWQNEKDVIGFDDGTCETKVRFVCQSKGLNYIYSYLLVTSQITINIFALLFFI
jgi:hypothetical protein